MVRANDRELLCREAIDQGAMALKSEAEPTGFGSQIGKSCQDAEAVGVGQGVDGTGGKGGASRGPVALLAESPPGQKLAAHRLGEGREGSRGLNLRSAARGGA